MSGPRVPLAIGDVLAEAWALWRRDRDLLLRIALPFLFLPGWALMLLLPAPTPIPDGATLLDKMEAMNAYVSANLGASLVAWVVSAFGQAALLAFYCDTRVATVGDALRRATLLLPRFLLAKLLVGLAVAAGLLALLVGALVAAGRTMLTGPAVFAERQSAVQAVARSVALTRGLTLPVAALAAALFAAQWLGQPFAALDAALGGSESGNPVAIALVGAAGALVAAAVELAGVLIAVALYRRLASIGT